MQKSKILNIGSLNIDHVYRVREFVKPGETIQSLDYNRFAGGKGLNQSIALARANAEVIHAGKVGSDANFLLELLNKEQVNTDLIEISTTESSGHAIIQVSEAGQNCIVLYGGTNLTISSESIDKTIDSIAQGDFIVLQNEINNIEQIIQQASIKGVKIFFNPAPITPQCFQYSIDLIDTLIVNECEAAELSQTQSTQYSDCLVALQKRYPNINILMTLGKEGAIYYNKKDNATLTIPAPEVENIVDTTAAGDTFVGYFVAMLAQGKDYCDALNMATQASGVTISRSGAASSIPYLAELNG